MRKIALLLWVALAATAQVQIKLTPDTASQTAIIGHAHGLQYWVLTMANTGNAPRTLAIQQVIIGSPVNLIPLGDAKNIVGATIARSFWGNVLHYGTIAAEGTGLVLAIAKGLSPGISSSTILKLSLAGTIGMGAEQLVGVNLRDPSPLYNQLQYPITLGAAGTPTAYATDHEFSTGWTKRAAAGAQVFTVQ